MRPLPRVLRAACALVGAAALVVPSWTGSAHAANATVNVGENNENKFTPARVTIKTGDTVTWQYAGGSGHTVTSTTKNWDKNDQVGPPAVLQLSTSYLFDAPGTYRYVCSTHESVGMKGVVVVEARSKPSPTPTKTSSPKPSPSRSTAPSSAPPSSAPPSASGSASASPSAGTATPVVPSGSAPPSPTLTPVPLPSVATPTQFLGTGGLTPQPATPRGKGLPVMLALLLIGGVGSAEIRALLASAPE